MCPDNPHLIDHDGQACSKTAHEIGGSNANQHHGLNGLFPFLVGLFALLVGRFRELGGHSARLLDTLELEDGRALERLPDLPCSLGKTTESHPTYPGSCKPS